MFKGSDGKCMGLCVGGFGLALGITCGLFMLAYAWSSWLFGYGTAVVAQHAMMYPGYGPSLVGGLIGGLWGLVHGFIFGVIAAYLYNKFMRRCCGKTEA